MFRLQRDRLEFRGGREADAERGVVRELLLRVVQAAEVHGPLADLAVQGDVRVHVQVRARLREIVVRGLDGDRAVWQADTIHHRRRPADQEDVRRFEEDASPELRGALTADDLDLVRVVMRSEERRVGKEGRSRWWRGQLKRKNR